MFVYLIINDATEKYYVGKTVSAESTLAADLFARFKRDGYVYRAVRQTEGAC